MIMLLGLYVISRIASFRRKTTHNVQCSQEDKTSEERSNLIGRRWKKKSLCEVLCEEEFFDEVKFSFLEKKLIHKRAKRASFIFNTLMQKLCFVDKVNVNHTEPKSQKFNWQLWIFAPKLNSWKIVKKRHLSINNYSVLPKSVLDAVLLHYQCS